MKDRRRFPAILLQTCGTKLFWFTVNKSFRTGCAHFSAKLRFPAENVAHLEGNFRGHGRCAGTPGPAGGGRSSRRASGVCKTAGLLTDEVRREGREIPHFRLAVSSSRPASPSKPDGQEGAEEPSASWPPGLPGCPGAASPARKASSASGPAGSRGSSRLHVSNGGSFRSSHGSSSGGRCQREGGPAPSP